MAKHDELRRALIEFDRSGTRTHAPLRLCEFAADRLGMQGVGVALMSSPDARDLLAAAGPLAGKVEELQFNLGEGPGLEAFHSVTPCAEGYLAGAGAARWPLFAPAARVHGVEAVFAFPLTVGAACFGVLDLARDRPGALNDDEVTDALVLADIATDIVLTIQSRHQDGGVADELRATGSERIVVHQATGMVAAQTNTDVASALAQLRAHAYATNQALVEVAQQVVARTLAFGTPS